MIVIYGDESESFNPHVFTLAGWVASLGAWDVFDKAWKELLKTIGPHPVSALHMKAISQPNVGEFADWSQEQKDALVRGAVDLLVDRQGPISNLYAIGCTMVVDDIKVHAPTWTPTSDELYSLCYDSFLFQAITLPVVMSGIDFVFDRRKGIQGNVLKYFSETKDKMEATAVLKGKIGACAFEDDFKVPALQAADLLAYELRRYVWQRHTSPDRPMRRSYERLRAGATVRSFRCYDRRFMGTLEAHERQHGPFDGTRSSKYTFFTLAAPED